MKFNQTEALMYNFSVEGTFDLANMALRLNAKRVLDIGFGSGGASMFFASHGRQVTGIGLAIEQYDYSQRDFKELAINYEETSLEEFKSTEKFDMIWASHVLEHNLNVGFFLDKCRELLSEKGWLCIMVPPFKNEVVGGHVSTGWNLGQLMYVLLLCGYDIKHGHFIQHGYSLCAFVQESETKLPKLKMDIGDIEATSTFWPIEVKQDFNGDIKQINWFDDFKTYEIDKRQLKSLQQENIKLKNALQEQTKEFMVKIRDEVRAEREKLKLFYNVPVQQEKPTLYNRYKRSTIPRKLQFLKKIPVIGSVALFIKQRLFGWHC